MAARSGAWRSDCPIAPDRQHRRRDGGESQVSPPRRQIRLTKTKTSSPRIVPLSDTAMSTLVATPRHITSPYVFWHDDGQRYTTFADIFAATAKRATVPFHCHDLRHAFAMGHENACYDSGSN